MEGWTRQGEKLVQIKDMEGWVSPRLKIRFSLSTGDITLHRPDGTLFLSPPELDAERQKATLKAQDEAAARQREARRADDEARRADAAESRAARLAERLRALGIDPEAP